MNALKTLYQSILNQLGWPSVNISELNIERFLNGTGFKFISKSGTQWAVVSYKTRDRLFISCCEKVAEHECIFMSSHIAVNQNQFVFRGYNRNGNPNSLKTVKLDITADIFEPFAGY